MYAWVKRNGFPEGFRILCHNCNMSHGMYGYCPHKTPSKVCEPLTVRQRIQEKILEAATELVKKGIYPSIPKLKETTGHGYTFICDYRRRLIAENKWPDKNAEAIIAKFHSKSA